MYDPPNNAPVWPQPGAQQTPPRANAPERMPATEARRRAKTLKRVTLAGTTLTFCALAGLAASHVTGITSAAGTGSSPTAAPSNQDGHGNFFSGGGRESDDGEHHNSGSSQSGSGGFNFGSGGSSFQPPASSSSGS